MTLVLLKDESCFGVSKPLKTDGGKMERMGKMTIREQVELQMRIIKKGAERLVGEEELYGKLEECILTGKPLTVKFGVDPSGPDVHLGHTVLLRKLKQLQELGHDIVVVIGDFTGKSKGRRGMTDREILLNAQTCQDQIFRILDRERTQVRFNGEWLELLGADELLKLASCITVERMLERDDFERRFQSNTPIGLHELFYPLLQAFDSVELEADLEVGGTDQAFHLLMSRSLQREKGQRPQAVLFMPALEGIPYPEGNS